MADRIKNYEIQYNILSNATQAAEGFAALLGYVEKLSGKDPSTGMARGLTKISGEINQVVKDTTRLKTAFAEIRPEIDMTGFKSQIGQMQRAVAEFAQQTRNIMRMAMSGTDKQFAKARGAMSGSIFDAASLRWFEDELKKMPQRINDATKAVTDAQNKYNAAINAQRSYPVGATAQQIKDIDDAANREQKALLANLNNRQRALKGLQEQQENYTRQAQNLRSTLSEEAMRPVPGPATVTVPKGITKATDLIPKWQQEYEKARALALAKRAELAKSVGQPAKVEKPTWYGSRSPFGTTYDAYMRDYDAAAKKYATTQSIAQQRIMDESRMHFMGGTGFNETQFNEAYKQYQAYEKYRENYRQWVAAGKPQGQAYNQTDEYKNYRASLKRLRAAYGAQRQGEALKARMAATATTAPAGGAAGGPLPPILGIQPQIIEQAFTGKLTLLPDLPAARSLIAAETFNANLNLVPLIAELRAKLNSEKFSVNVTPQLSKARGAAKGKGAAGAIGTLQEELNQLKSSAKVPIAIGTQLDRTGLLGRAQSGYNVLQELAKRHPITYKLASDGSGGFSLNQALARLTELAKSRPVPFRMVHDGSGGLALNQALARLQSLANTRPIQLKTALSGNGTINVNSIKPTGSVNVPLRGVLYKKNITPPSTPIQVKVAAKIAGGNNKNFGLNINTLGLESKVAQLERLRTVWASLPRTGSRTYTVNLKTTGLENIARLEQLLRLVNKMPPSDRRSYNIAARVSETGGRTTTIGAIGGSRRTPVYTKSADDFYTRSRKWAYPFTGNTSFGARTPAAFDMMKGMGVMMGIGGAMGVIGGSFSDAVNYQNVMETAKAILRDNYKGNNFNSDYADMVRVVRDVAMRTKFTAPEAADAARFMAMAGLDIPMIKSAIAPIADVAAISDTDLGQVADKMTNIMTEFNVAPDKMRNLADMMTKTFTSTNTDMMMLAESLQYAGPMAFASGQTLAETLAMIGIMGNSGIQASMAGTTMRMMLQNIYKPNKNQAKFMESIGLKTRDANGNRRPLYDILSDITKITGKSDTKNVVGNLLAGKDAKANIDTFDAASNLFRVTAAAGGASLLGNIGGLAELVTKIQGASGNSAAVSLAKQNTVAGMWAQAKSAFTEAVVKVFEDTGMQQYIKGTLKDIIDYLKQPEFIKTMKDLFDLIKAIGSVLAKFVGWWIKLYQTFPNLVKWVMTFQMFFTQVGYLITPFVQLTGLITSFGKAIGGLFAPINAIYAATTATRGGMAATAVASAMGNVMYGANMAPAATIGSALIGGSVKGGRFADIYAKRAAAYRTAAVRQYDMIGSFVAGRSLQYMGDSDRIALQQMLNRRNRLTEMGTGYGLLAMQSAMINRQRKASQLKNSELLYRAARQGRLSWGNLGRGMGTAFTTAFAANTMSSALGGAWASIRGGFTSVATTLAKGAGLLLNPVTLTAAALGGLATAAYIAKEKLNRVDERFNKRIEEGKNQKDVVNKILNPDKVRLIGNGQAISLDGTNHYESGLRVDPLLMNLRGVSEAFDSRKSYHSPKEYNRSVYNGLISPMSRFLFGEQLSFEDIANKAGKYDDLYRQDEAQNYIFRKYAQQASVIHAAFQDPRTVREFENINKLVSDWQNLPLERRLETRGSLIEKIKAIRQKFSGWVNSNSEHLFDLDNLSNIRAGRAFKSYEGQKAIWDTINDIITASPNSKFAEIFAATDAFSSDITTRNQALSSLMNLVGPMKFYNKDGKVVEIPLSFNGLTPYWEGLYAQFDKLRVSYKGTAEERKTILQYIFERLANIPGIAEILKNVIDINQKANYTPRDYMREISSEYGTGANWGIKDIPIKSDNGVPVFDWPSVTPKKNTDYLRPFWMNDQENTDNKSAWPSFKPLAYNSSDINSGYESSYSQNSLKPTQVVVNIDKLMNTDKMTIASDAEERQLAGAMEDKIEQALDILKGQIVSSLQRGDYSVS